MEYNISDHLPIYIIKKGKRTVREKTYVYSRSYKNYDKKKLQGNLKNLDWSIFDLPDNVDDMYMIYKAIEYEVNRMCPYKKFKITTNRPEWMTK